MIELQTVELATPGTQPDYHYPPYISTIARSPRMPLITLPETLTERTGPVFGNALLRAGDNDLTAQPNGEPIGERDLRTRPCARRRRPSRARRTHRNLAGQRRGPIPTQG